MDWPTHVHLCYDILSEAQDLPVRCSTAGGCRTAGINATRLCFHVCSEKRGFFARLRKKNAPGDEDTTGARASQRVDPSTFPDVKSRRSTLPPIQPELGAEGDDAPAAGRGRRRKSRRRVDEDADEVDAGQHKMSSLRELPPLYPSAEQQDQQRRASRRPPPPLYEDNEDDFWPSPDISSYMYTQTRDTAKQMARFSGDGIW